MELSALALGAMRLPVIDGDDSNIDVASADRMVDYAMEQGVNYYDTAYGYHGGQSEIVLGNALRKYPRESYYLADKFPGYDLSYMDKVEEIFEEQLKKCGVEYFDFYMFHNVCEMNLDAYLDEKYGILAYLLKQKENGRIRHLGFSAHGSHDVIKQFLENYGQHMEFCQLQLNYIDWTFQDGEAKVALLNDYHIPVWVMEPLRGGKLASLTEQDAAALAALRPNETAPAWAFRFLQSVPGVTLVLSGMSNMTQLKENIETYREEKPLGEKEYEALMLVAQRMISKVALLCTECRYCISHCPQGLDIPDLISLYNEHCSTVNGFIAPMALMAMAEEKRPNACIGCRNCEAVCPQQIKISDAFSDFVMKVG